VKEFNKAVCIAKSQGQQGCKGSEQVSVYMNEKHRINTGSESVIVENKKVHERVMPN